MTLATQIASDLLDIKAVYLKPEEPFTWASGIKSPISTDNRITLSYPETRTLIENGFVEKIKEEFPEVEVIAGTATAGIPHGAIIEDLISTGGSVLDAVAAAEREGADVIGVVAIFTYELPKAEKNFADAGVKLVTLSNYTELIKVAKVQGYITADGLQLLKKFKENQETWQD